MTLQDARSPQGTLPLDLPSCTPPTRRLPDVTVLHRDAFSGVATRKEVLLSKQALRDARHEALAEARTQKTSASERGPLNRKVQASLFEEDRLEGLLQTQFLPQHGPSQLISPRAFFVSPLFSVRSKTVERARFTEFSITVNGAAALGYAGPELRQSDGLVFMALLNMARDVQVGMAVSFSVEDFCRAVFGRYDGPARKRLREHIQRLQSALLKFDTFSVQLCQRFDYPKSGPWTVALDRQIVELFRQVPQVWLELEPRLTLPEGIATWLYAFVESQSTLIPTKVELLRDLCGSEATPRAFENKLREALVHLTSHQVIDAGWSLKKGMLRWRKAIRQDTSASNDATSASPADSAPPALQAA